MASFPDDATLMRVADRTLYAAKRQGRDRIETAATTNHLDVTEERLDSVESLTA